MIATTIGVNLVDQNGATTVIGSDEGPPPSEVAVSPDGRYAMLEGQARAELWSIDAGLVAAFEGPTSGTFTADGSVLMTSSPSQVTAGPATETPQTVIAAPAGTELGAAAMTPDGQVIAAPVTGDGPDLITYTASTGAITTDIFVEPERKVARADFGGRRDRLLLQVSSQDPFADQLVAWDSDAGQVVWETAAGSLSSNTVWDVGLDGRVLTAEGSALRLIGLEGTVDRRVATRRLPDGDVRRCDREWICARAVRRHAVAHGRRRRSRWTVGVDRPAYRRPRAPGGTRRRDHRRHERRRPGLGRRRVRTRSDHVVPGRHGERRGHVGRRSFHRRSDRRWDGGDQRCRRDGTARCCSNIRKAASTRWPSPPMETACSPASASDCPTSPSTTR